MQTKHGIEMFPFFGKVLWAERGAGRAAYLYVLALDVTSRSCG